jgi:hypothetical protein
MNFNAAHVLDNDKIYDRKHKKCVGNRQAAISSAGGARAVAARHRSRLS